MDKNKKPIKNFFDGLDIKSKFLKDNTGYNMQDWIIAVLFGLGFYYFSHSHRIYTQEFLLFITFIAILWYSKETFWLKHVQEKTLNQQRVYDDYQIMPFIDLSISLYHGHKNGIKNSGKGIAQDLQLSFSYKLQGVEKKQDVFVNYLYPGEFIEFNVIDEYNLLSDLGGLEDSDQVIVVGRCLDVAKRSYIFKFIKHSDDEGYRLIYQKPDKWAIGEGFNVKD